MACVWTRAGVVACLPRWGRVEDENAAAPVLVPGLWSPLNVRSPLHAPMRAFLCARRLEGHGIVFDGGITNLIPVPPNCPGAVRVACFPHERLSSIFPGIGISPSSFESWPHDMTTMIRWALEPATEDMLLYLVEKGKQDTRAWALQNDLPTPFKPMPVAAAVRADFGRKP